MAQEATKVHDGSLPDQPWNISDKESFEKGTVMLVSGAGVRIAYPSKVSSTNVAFAGIATTEKVALDGQTTIGLARGGIWDIYVSDTTNTAAGALAKVSGSTTSGNCFSVAGAAGDISGGFVAGRFMETTANGTAVNIAVGYF